MNELIKVEKKTIGDEEINAVDARDLHEFLEVKEHFTDWIKRYLEEYGFVMNSDFCRSKRIASNGRKMETYIVTIDMAKELSMISRTEKGKQARRYFIEMEKVARGKQPKRLPQPERPKELPEWAVEGEAVAYLMKRYGCNEAMVAAEEFKHIYQMGGPDLRNVVGQLPCAQNIKDDEVMLEPKELGQMFGISAIKMNQLLEDIGLQTNVGKKWIPSEQALHLCSRHLWNKNGKSGYNYKWNYEKIKKLVEEKETC